MINAKLSFCITGTIFYLISLERQCRIAYTMLPDVGQIFKGLYDLGLIYNLLDKILNRGPVHQLFTTGTLKTL